LCLKEANETNERERMKKIILIIGGARSGKSRFAKELAGNLGDSVLFVATGEPLDEEMQARINEHKELRPKGWRTLEIPTNVAQQLRLEIGDADVVIIDCLTLLISNRLGEELDYPKAEKQVLSEIHELITSIKKLNAIFIIVSNEVGMGLVPETRLGRVYRDLLGRANQLIAQHANEVYFMVAGLPVVIRAADKG
jgi:adenosylcobinamide kinase/adenosylcobinamide-phosphate guanylyltransferase